jgi:hypothetical protein
MRVLMLCLKFIWNIAPQWVQVLRKNQKEFFVYLEMISKRCQKVLKNLGSKKSNIMAIYHKKMRNIKLPIAERWVFQFRRYEIQPIPIPGPTLTYNFCFKMFNYYKALPNVHMIKLCFYSFLKYSTKKNLGVKNQKIQKSLIYTFAPCIFLPPLGIFGILYMRYNLA